MMYGSDNMIDLIDGIFLVNVRSRKKCPICIDNMIDLIDG